MASLQRIRNHGTLLIIIVGVAMLAFILGDALSQSSALRQLFGAEDPTTVGVVEGNKLSYAEYDASIKELESLYPSSAQSEDFQTQVRYAVWNLFLQENIIRSQAEKIGMDLTSEEMTELCLGEKPHQMIASNPAFLDENGEVNRTGIAQFINMLNEADEETQQSESFQLNRNFWLDTEHRLRVTYMREKYEAILQHLLKVNTLDAEFAFNNRQHGVSAEYVMQPYYTIADSLVKVSESDIKKLYNEKKELFKQTPTRAIEYIVFNITPSAEDFEAEKAKMEGWQEEFRTAEDVTIVVNPNSDIVYDGRDYTKETIPAQFAEFAFAKGAKEGDCTDLLFDGQTYSMARIMKVGYSVPDSVELKVIVEGGEDTEIGWLDEARLKAFAAQQQLGKDFINQALNTKRGGRFTATHGLGELSFEVMDVSKASPRAKVAILSRAVDASDRTRAGIYNNASAFIAEHNNAEAFEQAAQEAGYTVTPQYNLTALSEKVGNIKGTREIVRWAFKAKEGAVCNEPYRCDNDQYIVIAALKEVNESEYRPLEDLRGQLSLEATNKAKAQYVAKQLKGVSSLEEVSTILGQPIQHTERVTLNDSRFGNAGMEPAVIGATLALDENQLSEVIGGKAGVFVVKAGAAINTNEDFQPEYEKLQLANRTIGWQYQQTLQLLEDESEIKDNRANFQ